MKAKDYFNELYYRLLFCLLSWFINTILLYVYKDQLFYFLGNYQTNNIPSFLATNLPEVFLASIKLTLFMGFYLSLPVCCLNIWYFLKPALYEFEAKKIQLLLKISLFIYLGTMLFTVFILIPTSWKFFSSFEVKSEILGLSIHLEARLNEYLSFLYEIFFTLSILSYSFFFFLLFSHRYTLNLLIKQRKLLFFSFLCLATLITPPDVFSQIFVTLIFILGYEFFLINLYIFREYRKRASNGI